MANELRIEELDEHPRYVHVPSDVFPPSDPPLALCGRRPIARWYVSLGALSCPKCIATLKEKAVAMEAEARLLPPKGRWIFVPDKPTEPATA